MRIAHGEGAEPDADERLRNLFAVCSYMAIADGAGTAHDFLLEPNAELDGRAPAELLHDGASRSASGSPPCRRSDNRAARVRVSGPTNTSVFPYPCVPGWGCV